jgi:hypothetical protein
MHLCGYDRWKTTPPEVLEDIIERWESELEWEFEMYEWESTQEQEWHLNRDADTRQRDTEVSL